MRSRFSLPAQDRQARSRLLQSLGRGDPVLKASLVAMARLCGKPRCRCGRGHKHVSWYLSARVGGRRAMIYLPPALEAAARQWVANGRAVEGWLRQMSEASLERLLARKEAKP